MEIASFPKEDRGDSVDKNNDCEEQLCFSNFNEEISATVKRQKFLWFISNVPEHI